MTWYDNTGMAITFSNRHELAVPTVGTSVHFKHNRCAKGGRLGIYRGGVCECCVLALFAVSNRVGSFGGTRALLVEMSRNMPDGAPFSSRLQRLSTPVGRRVNVTYVATCCV